MRTYPLILPLIGFSLLVFTRSLIAADGETLFTQNGKDAPFEELQAKRALSASEGVKGSSIRVRKNLVETTPEAKRPICGPIKLHTLLSSSIPRKEFGKWTRWYQEDGHTQVFRLFKDEVNLNGARDLAARVETFSARNWSEADGKWHEWSAVVTAIKPIGMIFQVKDSKDAWAVSISITPEGDVKLNHRRGQDDKIIATGMIRKPFHLRVRDNGLDYEVFLNGEEVGKGTFARPDGSTAFRWGMYVGESKVNYDAMILFSGATVDGNR